MANTNLRIGHGYDVHRLVDGRKLILGGVDIPWEKGLLGHSDADVLTHAVMDSLLGALALEQHGDGHKGGQAHDGEDDTAEDRGRAAQKPAHAVKAEQAHQQPVDAADDGQYQ